MAKVSRVKTSAAIGAALVALVGAWEGVRLVAYRDIVGVPTICQGITEGVKMGQTSTVAECKVRFKDELDKHSIKMERCLKSPESLPDKVYIALASLVYNVGPGAVCDGSPGRYANSGDLRKACDSILLYNKARVDGKLQVVKGLDNRRKQEHKICLEGL